MSELNETPGADEPDDETPQLHDPPHGPDEASPSVDASGTPAGDDARPPKSADAAPGVPSASPHDPWGPNSAARSERAVWPTINSWRAPLLAPNPLPVTTEMVVSRGRSWMSVAVVAALIGAFMGGATAWLARSSPSSALITIREGTAIPGAAILASGTPIPRLVDAVSPSVVSVDVTTGFGGDEGTGMIISSNGLVLTNNHVIAAITGAAGGGSITVTRTGTSIPLAATLLGTSQRYDVALLQIQNASGLPAITFGNSGKLVVGDGVVAIGNALGLAAGTPTVTSGIVSALGRTVSASDAQTGQSETLYGMIQTDAAINPGNSGGPLIDSSGQVVGMNTAVAGATSEGGTAQNIGFAIPAARIEHLLSSLLRMHLPTNPRHKGAFLGVKIVSDSAALAHRYRLFVSKGAYVVSVTQGYPAQRAGVQAGDVIVSINGTAIADNFGVARVLQTISPGTTVKVIVERGRSQVVAFVTTVARPPGA
jgi:putative serine protease PepD